MFRLENFIKNRHCWNKAFIFSLLMFCCRLILLFQFVPSVFKAAETVFSPYGCTLRSTGDLPTQLALFPVHLGLLAILTDEMCGLN